MPQLSPSGSVPFYLRDVSRKHGELLRDFEAVLFASLKEHRSRCQQFHVDNKQLPLYDYSKKLRQLNAGLVDEVSNTWAASERKLSATVTEIVEESVRQQRESQRSQKRDHEKRIETVREAYQAVTRNHEVVTQQCDDLAARLREAEALVRVKNEALLESAGKQVAETPAAPQTSKEPAKVPDESTTKEFGIDTQPGGVQQVVAEESNEVFVDVDELTNELRNRKNELGCAHRRISELESHVAKLQEQFLEERKRRDAAVQAQHDTVVQMRDKNIHEISTLVQSLEEQLRDSYREKVTVDEKFKVVCWAHKRSIESAKQLRIRVAWKTAICKVLVQCARRTKKHERHEAHLALDKYVSRVKTFVAEVEAWRVQHGRRQQQQQQQLQQQQQQHRRNIDHQHPVSSGRQRQHRQQQQQRRTSTSPAMSSSSQSQSAAAAFNVPLSFDDVPGKRIVSTLLFEDLVKKHASLWMNDGPQTPSDGSSMPATTPHQQGDHDANHSQSSLTGTHTAVQTTGELMAHGFHAPQRPRTQAGRQQANGGGAAATLLQGMGDAHLNRSSTSPSRVEHHTMPTSNQQLTARSRVTLKDLKPVRHRPGQPWQQHGGGGESRARPRTTDPAALWRKLQPEAAPRWQTSL